MRRALLPHLLLRCRQPFDARPERPGDALPVHCARIHASMNDWLSNERLATRRSGPTRSPSGDPAAPHRALQPDPRRIGFDRRDRCINRVSPTYIGIPPTSTKFHTPHLPVRPPGMGSLPTAPRFATQETGQGRCLAYCRAAPEPGRSRALAGGGRFSMLPMRSPTSRSVRLSSKRAITPGQCAQPKARPCWAPERHPNLEAT